MNQQPAAKRRPSPSLPAPDNPNASSLDHRHYSDNSTSYHSSYEIRTPIEEESRDHRTTSQTAKYIAVIPTPSDIHQNEDQSVDSDPATENGVTESIQDQPLRSEKIKKKSARKPLQTKAANSDRPNRRNREQKNSAHRPSCRIGHSSDEEKGHRETGCFSRRPISSRPTSSCQQLGMYRPTLQRATSAPIRRPQWRPVSAGFSGGSRMDMKELLESLLHSDTFYPRRKSFAEPVECRRKRNYTFSDERLEMIERENKRLLEKMVMIQHSEPTYSRAREKRATPAVKPTLFSDFTRIKQLEKIQTENTVCQQRYSYSLL